MKSDKLLDLVWVIAEVGASMGSDPMDTNARMARVNEKARGIKN